MRRSIFSTLAAASLALAAVPAGAAAEGPDWSGVYLGAYAGATSGSSTATTVVGCPSGGYLCNEPDDIQMDNGLFVSAIGSGSTTGGVFTGGGFAGRNWQDGGIVYGLEADIGAMPFRLTNGGSAITVNEGLENDDGLATFSMTATAATDWLATARARLGFLPHPNLLLYGTAGLAATQFTVSNAYADNFMDPGGPGARESASRSEFRTALAIGAGAEWALSERWTFRAEYLHVDFGSLAVTGGVSYENVFTDANMITSTVNLRVDVVRVGVAYGF